MRLIDEGLKTKYIVHKAETGEEVNDCFILRPDRDAAAVAAIRAYAAVTENKALANDLIQWVGPEPNGPLTLEELREMDGMPVFVTKNGESLGYALVYSPCSIVYITCATGSKWDVEDLIDEGCKFYRRKLEEVI